MKTSLRLTITLSLAVLLSTVQAQDFTYTTTDGTVTITKYTGPGGAVIIPDTIEGLPVTGIGNWAFRDCTGLTNLTIPNSVTVIYADAIIGCRNLTSVTLGKSVATIGTGNFEFCTSLRGVHFGGNAPPSSSILWGRRFYGLLPSRHFGVGANIL